MIPVVDPGAQYLRLRRVIDEAIGRVLASGHYVLGPEVESFESEFAAFCGVSGAVGVNSGTDALMLALRAAGVRPGDEVVTVSHTAVATVAAILAIGAVPVLADIDPVSANMDPGQLEQVISRRTSAVVAVHLYGSPADMHAVIDVADRHGLPVIEDCAQAAGAVIGDQRVGSFGVAGCFSFYPTKNLAAMGDGGMVVTRDARFAEKVRRLRQYGWDRVREAQEPGVNSRLDEVQAAILREKLKTLDTDNQARREIATRYRDGLSDCGVELPCNVPGHVYHLFVVQTPHRDRRLSALQTTGVGVGVHYRAAVHMQNAYADQCVLPVSGLPVTERFVSRAMSLPMYPELQTHDVDKVNQTMREVCGGDV